jgi:hypothetical protein
LRPAVIGLVGFILIITVALATAQSTAAIWAGTTFLLTCGLLGLAVLGAVCGQGKRRDIWLGSSLFGVTYMIVCFGPFPSQLVRPCQATDQFLIALRSASTPLVIGFTDSSKVIGTGNARILKALEQPVPMRFPSDTPLEDVLHYIKKATTTPTSPGIPIYVDPIGLQEAERSLTSTVTIDLEGVPLGTTMRLCLEQLGLQYYVKDGLLRITSSDTGMSPSDDDPFLIVGHCILALIAAGLGGVLAPLVSDRYREPPGRAEVG